MEDDILNSKDKDLEKKSVDKGINIEIENKDISIGVDEEIVIDDSEVLEVSDDSPYELDISIGDIVTDVRAGEVNEVMAETNIMVEKENRIKELLSKAMGSALHEEWRKTRLNSDGTFEPRIKTTTDQEWIKANGTNQVDIANCTFAELPSDWQYENLEAARVAINQTYNPIMQKDEINSDRIEEMSSKVHDELLKRNEWAKGGELDVEYEKLPEEEKAKDRNQILQAIDLVSAYSRGEIDIEKLEKEFGNKEQENMDISD